MPQDRPGDHPGHRAADHVQVGPADGGGGQADDRVGRLLNLGLRDVIEAYVAQSVEYNGLHFDLPGSQMSGLPPVTATVAPAM